MKYLKTFESLDGPQVGDYVACEEDSLTSDFTSTNVGKIVNIEDDRDNKYYHVVAYDDIPKDIEDLFDSQFGYLCRDMSRYEIEFWSKNRLEVEAYIAAKKYNL